MTLGFKLECMGDSTCTTRADTCKPPMREPCWTKTPVSSKNSVERLCGVVENRSEERLGVKKGDVDEGKDSQMHTGVSKITLLAKSARLDRNEEGVARRREQATLSNWGSDEVSTSPRPHNPSWRLKTPPRDTPRTPGPRPWV
jgi:hypothetical protein